MEDDQYHAIQEHEACSFPTRREMEDFMNRLPNMTALELLLLQNPLPFGGVGAKGICCRIKVFVVTSKARMEE